MEKLSEVSSWFSVWALAMNRYTLNLHLRQRKSAIHPFRGNFWGNVFLKQFEKIPQIAQDSKINNKQQTLFWGNVFLKQFEKIPQIAQDSKINNKQQTHAFARFRFSS